MDENVLITDFYQLTMAQAYYKQEMNDIAVFEFFIRKLPENRNFLIAAGLAQLLEYLEGLKFTADDIDFLKKKKTFKDDFLDYLKSFSFKGDVFAMPEGTIFFPNEPVIQVIAPIIQAQLIESRLINIVHFQTMIASKAIRCVLMAQNKLLVDFGMRRAHGAEAGVRASRANYLTGFAGTATVLAGKLFDIPLYGTMAHSYIQAHDTEEIAFITFARGYPENVVLLIDTYDTEKAAIKITEIAHSLQEEGISIKAVRLDSGDLGKHAILVRKILDDAGLRATQIFASGDIDEFKLKDLSSHNYPIDGFGVGTKLDVSNDAPYLDCAYKLQEYAGQAKRKLSEAKSTWPGRKQVYRFYDDNDQMKYDFLTLKGEEVKQSKPLLEPVMQGGKVTKSATLKEIQDYVREQLSILPTRYKKLTPAKKHYQVKISQSLHELARAVDVAMGIY